MPKQLPTPKGYRKLKPGERIQAADIYWKHGEPKMGLSTEACRPSIGQKFDPPMQTQYYRAIETTTKTKETKNMTTKKPGASHGKPTAKGMKEALKPKVKEIPVEKIRAAAETELVAIAKRKNPPKYPAPRVQMEIQTFAKPLDKMTKPELQTVIGDYRSQFNNLAADHCIAGTKLDRALVDLKEAKAKIKALEDAR